MKMNPTLEHPPETDCSSATTPPTSKEVIINLHTEELEQARLERERIKAELQENTDKAKIHQNILTYLKVKFTPVVSPEEPKRRKHNRGIKKNILTKLINHPQWGDGGAFDLDNISDCLPQEGRQRISSTLSSLAVAGILTRDGYSNTISGPDLIQYKLTQPTHEKENPAQQEAND